MEIKLCPMVIEHDNHIENILIKSNIDFISVHDKLYNKYIIIEKYQTCITSEDEKMYELNGMEREYEISKISKLKKDEILYFSIGKMYAIIQLVNHKKRMKVHSPPWPKELSNSKLLFDGQNTYVVSKIVEKL